MCHAFLQSLLVNNPLPSSLCSSMGWEPVLSASTSLGGRGGWFGLLSVGPTSQYFSSTSTRFVTVLLSLIVEEEMEVSTSFSVDVEYKGGKALTSNDEDVLRVLLLPAAGPVTGLLGWNAWLVDDKQPLEISNAVIVSFLILIVYTTSIR